MLTNFAGVFHFADWYARDGAACARLWAACVEDAELEQDPHQASPNGTPTTALCFRFSLPFFPHPCYFSSSFSQFVCSVTLNRHAYMCVHVQLNQGTRCSRFSRLEPWPEDCQLLRIVDSCCFVPFTKVEKAFRPLANHRYCQIHAIHQSYTAPY